MDDFLPLPCSPSPIVVDFGVDGRSNKPAELIPSQRDTMMATIPAWNLKGWVKPSMESPGGVKLLVFKLTSSTLSLVPLKEPPLDQCHLCSKGRGWKHFLGGIPPPFHAHLVKCVIVIFGVLVYLWLYNAPSQVSSLGSSLVRLLYPAEDRKSTLSLISSSAVPLCPLWSRASL